MGLYRALLRDTAAGIAVLLLVWLVGCSKPPVPGEDGRGDLSGSRFETIWVDPAIMYSDTLVSLIRSERVDSVLLAPDEKGTRPPASIEFLVDDVSCNVSVNLLDAYGQMIQPLLLKRLPVGYYRLTVHNRKGSNTPLLPGPYMLEADVCNRKQRTEIQLD